MAVRVDMLHQGEGGLRGRLTPISDDAGITGEPATTAVSATVLTCSIDGKTGNYLAVNVPFCRFWGYTPGDLVGTCSFIQLRHDGLREPSAAEAAAVFNRLRAAGKTASASYRSYGWTSSGERREYEGLTTYVAQFDRWDCVLYVESHVDVAPSLPPYLSFHVNEAGRLVSISDYTCQVLGVRREDVIHQPAADVLTPGQPLGGAWYQRCQRAKAEPGKVFERDTITVTMATPRPQAGRSPATIWAGPRPTWRSTSISPNASKQRSSSEPWPTTLLVPMPCWKQHTKHTTRSTACRPTISSPCWQRWRGMRKY